MSDWEQQLRKFGTEADQLDHVHTISTGGAIIVGTASSRESSPTKEERRHAGQRPGSDGRSEARSRRGRREPSGPRRGAAVEAVKRRLSTPLEFEGLVERYPRTRALPGPSNSECSYLRIETSVFSNLARSAFLFVEIPHDGPYEPVGTPIEAAKREHPFQGRTLVPDIRVWITWKDGVLINAFHQYPDRSACIYMPGDWIWGRDSLKRLIHWSTLWIGKELHRRTFGRWPGRHHCSCWVRANRDVEDEWCGCGRRNRYQDCHREQDFQKTALVRAQQHTVAQRRYLAELRRRERSVKPPFAWW